MTGQTWIPHYPVYVPTKSRSEWNRAYTARRLVDDGVDFNLVVEPGEADAYLELVGELKRQNPDSSATARVLVLPEREDLIEQMYERHGGRSLQTGGSIPSRNWIKQHSIDEGHKRHWQLDDNIEVFRRLWRTKRIPVAAGTALRACEDFTDRYKNVAISGLNYQMFVGAWTARAYYFNVHVYSCTCVDNFAEGISGSLHWRGRYNEDTDICLQALAAGWCTVLINVFSANKITTMVTGGGNTDQLYKLDGRHEMAWELAKRWPEKIVRVDRRWGRVQHVVNWNAFRPKELTPQVSMFEGRHDDGSKHLAVDPVVRHELERDEEFDFDSLFPVDERGLKLRAQRETVRSARLRKMAAEFNEQAEPDELYDDEVTHEHGAAGEEGPATVEGLPTR